MSGVIFAMFISLEEIHLLVEWIYQAIFLHTCCLVLFEFCHTVTLDTLRTNNFHYQVSRTVEVIHFKLRQVALGNKKYIRLST